MRNERHLSMELARNDRGELVPEGRLGELETQMESGAKMIHDAIVEIHTDDLWRQTHDSFNSYCEQRWGLSRSSAFRMLSHGRVMRNLAETYFQERGEGPPPKPAVSHTQELNKLPPQEQGAAWQEAVEESGGKPTTADVEKATRRRQQQSATQEKPSVSAREYAQRAIKNLDTAMGNVSRAAHASNTEVSSRMLGMFREIRAELNGMDSML